MTEGLAQAYAFDVEIRASTEGLPAKGAGIDAHEIEEGEVYDNGATRVTAFAVDHGRVRPAFGYRVDYAGHSAVVSGDTRFSENLAKFAKGTDCLIHAAWSVGRRIRRLPGGVRLRRRRMRPDFSRRWGHDLRLSITIRSRKASRILFEPATQDRS
jgi:ribonuclease Z